MTALCTAVQNVLNQLHATPLATGNAVLVAGPTPADALAEVARAEGLAVESEAPAPQDDPNGQPADAERLLDLYDLAIAECSGEGPLYDTLCAQHAALQDRLGTAVVDKQAPVSQGA